MNCDCGHSHAVHDWKDGCRAFLCCDRKRNLIPGTRGIEHDGATHPGKPCLCAKYTDRWIEDREAGAIG